MHPNPPIHNDCEQTAIACLPPVWWCSFWVTLKYTWHQMQRMEEVGGEKGEGGEGWKEGGRKMGRGEGEGIGGWAGRRALAWCTFLYTHRGRSGFIPRLLGACMGMRLIPPLPSHVCEQDIACKPLTHTNTWRNPANHVLKTTVLVVVLSPAFSIAGEVELRNMQGFSKNNNLEYLLTVL